VLSAAVAPARWSTTLLSVFAAVALAIAVLGVFGVLSFLVTQRTRELGIRIALGADPRQLARSVVAGGMMLVALGIAGGFVLYAAAAPVLRGFLYGVTTTDPLTLATATAVLAATAALASWLPARRAACVDPTVALRAE
jgi:putative ABC transport system permease protein